ncbi:LytR/AlgR family response regulator transcription factor [Noviherbaspirillum autotrophicum]|uniref:LytR family transcriptional regulator n=1 Tax=Noviherbaspirillum autotrophicum TaxID=709839 RepID=A0A0C2BKQ4_9BURK|nr:LytTR family DNA-binding domain-containing protein [Noviherbaspirillum autotrophicum]KIF81815.1 LytR family transcriptional regulator [Noviherbaspirillum autotrophicum]
MTTIRALVAEDEPILAFTLVQTLARLWPELQVGGVLDNGVSAVQEALAQRPDVLFLDIRMPGKSGLEAAQELAEDWPADVPFPLVVFVTAYDDYALAAFEQAAADYVLKPVSDTRLAKTVDRLKARLQKNAERNSELERIVGQLRALVPAAPASGEKLSIVRAAVGNQIRMIPVADVHYFEAADKYVNIVTADSESLIRTSLRELLPQLDPNQFWQIHRGTVVNVHCVQAAVRDDSGKLALRLRGRSENLAVSRVFAHLFKQM